MAVVVVAIFGCTPERQHAPEPLTPALAKLLNYYDTNYDPSSQMLCIEFPSPGYHSNLPSGSRVHPTRESLIYALALLQRGRSDDVKRSEVIIHKVIQLQDKDSSSATFGVWPWHLEEPLEEMASPDFNWADFCGTLIAHILVKHSPQLPGGLQQEMRACLRHATSAIRKRDVGAEYTNVAVLGGGVCAVAGELLDDKELLRYGRQRLQKAVEHVNYHGTFNEYNSPPYCKVVIAECERTLHLVRDAETRGAAESLRRTAWKVVAESFHAGTQQWAGPHARTSRERLREETADFLSTRIGLPIETHPSMVGGEPRGSAVVKPLPCPEELVPRFRDLRAEPSQFARTFIRRDPESHSISGTTWIEKEFCLGSVNHSSFWTQRKPLIAYWKTSDDPAVVFRLRFLHDGKDFASMGIHTSQEGPRTLSLFHAVPHRGDWHRTLDRPTGGIFQASDLRIRCQLRGNAVKAKVVGAGKYSLLAGEHRAVIHSTRGRFKDRDIVWETDGDDESVYWDAICHNGQPRAFKFDDELEIALAIGVELLGVDQPISDQRPELNETGTEAKWQVSNGRMIRVP